MAELRKAAQHAPSSAAAAAAAPSASPMGREADELWRALDRLQATAPADYERFLASARAEMGGDAAAPARAAIVPQPGF